MNWPWKRRPAPAEVPDVVYPPGTKIIEAVSFYGVRLRSPYDELDFPTGCVGIRYGDKYTAIPRVYLPFGWTTSVVPGAIPTEETQ